MSRCCLDGFCCPFGSKVVSDKFCEFVPKVVLFCCLWAEVREFGPKSLGGCVIYCSKYVLVLVLGPVVVKVEVFLCSFSWG